MLLININCKSKKKIEIKSWLCFNTCYLCNSRSLTKDVSTLDKVDGYAEWRAGEAASLASEVEERLKNLQNPKDCDKAKKLVCSLNKVTFLGIGTKHKNILVTY